MPARALVPAEADVWRVLRQLLPSFGGYFLGFLTLGIFWVGQATQFTYMARSNRGLAWVHIFFLLVIGLLPFSVAFLNAYFPLRGAIILYWINIVLAGWTLFLSLRYARRHELLKATATPEIYQAMMRRILVAQCFYAGGMLLCFVSPWLSVGVIFMIQVNYALGLTRSKWLGN